MAVAAGPGPDREKTRLAGHEQEVFAQVVASECFDFERAELSRALEAVRRPLGQFVIDGFQRRLRRVWRTP